MTPNEYATKLRHCADVIERLGIPPISVCTKREGVWVLVRLRDFQREVQAKYGATQEDNRHGRFYSQVIDGVWFEANEEIPGSKVVTLPAAEASA